MFAVAHPHRWFLCLKLVMPRKRQRSGKSKARGNSGRLQDRRGCYIFPRSISAGVSGQLDDARSLPARGGRTREATKRKPRTKISRRILPFATEPFLGMEATGNNRSSSSLPCFQSKQAAVCRCVFGLWLLHPRLRFNGTWNAADSSNAAHPFYRQPLGKLTRALALFLGRPNALQPFCTRPIFTVSPSSSPPSPPLVALTLGRVIKIPNGWVTAFNPFFSVLPSLLFSVSFFRRENLPSPERVSIATDGNDMNF